MFIFKKVIIDNFRSVGHVELNLDNQGLVLVEGVNNTNQTFLSNGSGKSTMLSAIPWALYDVTPEGAKADDVINSKVGKNTSVILDFEVDGLPYTIERYRKHKTHKNKVRLLQGDNDLTESSVATTNKKILELFGIDLNTFLNSIMYGQGDVEIFAKASDKGKKEILENVANIAVYQQAQQSAKDKLAELNLTKTGLQQELQTYQARLGDLNYQEQSEAQSYKKTSDLIKHQQGVIEGLESDLALLLEAQGAQVSALNEQKSQLELALQNIQDPPLPQTLTDEYNAFNAQIINLQAVYNTKQQEINTVRATISSLGTSTNCPTCGTELDVSHREAERLRLESQVNDLVTAVSPTEQALPILQTQLAEKKSVLDNVYYEIQAVDQQKQQLMTNITNVTYQLQNVGNESNQLESKIATNKEQLANLEGLPKPVKRTKEKKEVQTHIDTLQGRVEQLVTDADEYDTVINKVLSNKGIRSHVLDLTTPFLNEKANGYLATLSGADIQINLATQKLNKDGSLADNFDLQVANGSGGSEYKTNSAGERKRIDLAIALAIQDLVFSKSNLATNLVIYDECFDGLDSIGCENVIDILKEKQKTIGSIFVITHNENLKSLFEKVITVEKVDGITSLVDFGGKKE